MTILEKGNGLYNKPESLKDNIEVSHISKKHKKQTTPSASSEQAPSSSFLLSTTHSNPCTSSSVLKQAMDNKPKDKSLTIKTGNSNQVIEVDNPGSTSGDNSINSNNHRSKVLSLNELEEWAKNRVLNKVVLL